MKVYIGDAEFSRVKLCSRYVVCSVVEADSRCNSFASFKSTAYDT